MFLSGVLAGVALYSHDSRFSYNPLLFIVGVRRTNLSAARVVGFRAGVLKPFLEAVWFQGLMYLS